MEELIKSRMRNKKLSEYACKDEDAVILYKEDDDIRTRFFRDSDRIIYSLSSSSSNSDVPEIAAVPFVFVVVA